MQGVNIKVTLHVPANGNVSVLIGPKSFSMWAEYLVI